ncbi:hypothetical protein HPB52_004582 [Rhipicephalus sanguineus]|uniref:Uncharacterized protein n=1 Tax=Rhipicephalus sanguineus TaxID=34632 RepID=A0A9D4QEH5_RHISA|nr:hypothetical protein HPB52_004582 [Rhipicephalus sanguineus]
MGKAKKSKHKGKAKKGKAGSKGKKGRHGSKGKKGSKKSSPHRKPHSGSRKGSSSSHHTKSSEPTSTSKSAGGSTPSQTEASAAPSEGYFKPLHRQPLPQLVLPADLDLTLPRRPSTIYLWDWGNVWFFPIGVLALAIVVLGMTVMSLSIQYADFQVQNETAASGNETNATLAESTTALSETTFERPRQWMNVTKRHLMEQTHLPAAPASSSSDDWARPSAFVKSTSPTEGAPLGTETPSATPSQAGDETENATASSGKAATSPTWLHAPVVYSLNASNLSFPLDESTAVDNEDLILHNASSV